MTRTFGSWIDEKSYVCGELLHVFTAAGKRKIFHSLRSFLGESFDLSREFVEKGREILINNLYYTKSKIFSSCSYATYYKIINQSYFFFLTHQIGFNVWASSKVYMLLQLGSINTNKTKKNCFVLFYLGFIMISSRPNVLSEKTKISLGHMSVVIIWRSRTRWTSWNALSFHLFDPLIPPLTCFIPLAPLRTIKSSWDSSYVTG